MEEMISIILPCYNQGIYLGEALESIIKQTYRNWEAIIVNDGSSDCTEEVALEYVAKDSRIHYFAQENKGVSAAPASTGYLMEVLRLACWPLT
jgi:glycosyltransferase involved in cell wall biosynthesis